MYGQTSSNKKQSPNLWHVTSILVCCIFAWLNDAIQMAPHKGKFGLRFVSFLHLEFRSTNSLLHTDYLFAISFSDSDRIILEPLHKFWIFCSYMLPFEALWRKFHMTFIKGICSSVQPNMKRKMLSLKQYLGWSGALHCV